MRSPCLATEQACHQGGLQRVCAHEAGGRAVSRNQCPSACSCDRDTTTYHQQFSIPPNPKTLMLCDTVSTSPSSSIQYRDRSTFWCTPFKSLSSQACLWMLISDFLQCHKPFCSSSLIHFCIGYVVEIIIHCHYDILLILQVGSKIHDWNLLGYAVT